jgi:hypothetical protein
MGRTKPPPVNTKIVPGGGDPCPRCNWPTQIREHVPITPEVLARRHCHYTRWFCCINPDCVTTVITPDRYRVMHEQQRQPCESYSMTRADIFEKLMMLTTSPNDAEALAALRKANAILTTARSARSGSTA